MAVEERDKYSGYLTTGHSWNGISELNTRVPTVLILFLLGSFLFSVAYWYFMPSWPGVNSFSPGALGVDQQDQIEDKLAVETAKKAIWTEQLLSQPLNELADDEEIQKIVRNSGPSLFGDNCATSTA